MGPITLYSGSIGLNNKVPPHRLGYDPETGVAALEETTDVLISITGEVSSRSGSKTVMAGNFHSMYPCDGGFYVVEDRDTDSAIYKATTNPDGSIDLTGIRSGLSKGKIVDYCRVEDRMHYCNGYQHGILNNVSSSEWPVNVWPGPQTSTMVRTVVGEFLDVLSGRIVLSRGKEIFFTEYGLPGLMDNVRNRRRFENDIIMISAVQTGVFVSDTKSIFFLLGTNPNNWELVQVTDYPAVRGGSFHSFINPINFGIDAQGLSVLFATVNGPAIGLQDGSIINLIDENISMPASSSCQNGALMVVDDSLILQS